MHTLQAVGAGCGGAGVEHVSVDRLQQRISTRLPPRSPHCSMARLFHSGTGQEGTIANETQMGHFRDVSPSNCQSFGLICQKLNLTQQKHTHTHPLNGPFFGTTRVSRYQYGKTNLDFTEARDSEWQWHQLGHMQVCTLLQTDNHTSTPPLFFTGRMPFLPPNQQRLSTEGNRERKCARNCSK